MPCFHPLRAFKVGVNPSGKDKFLITSGKDDFAFLRDGHWLSGAGFFPQGADKIIRDFIEIPCGQCRGCRLAYAQQWSYRMLMESKYHDCNYFVTLTYNDDHLPRAPCCDPFTGELIGANMTLRKSDVSAFMKDLRSALHTKFLNGDISDDKVRFYASGEYGDLYGRPHYHLIIFGLELPDKMPKCRARHSDGDYFTSKFLDDVWKKGNVIIAKCTAETCNYTARYVMKKLKGQLSYWYELQNIEPEFCLMSRRPGIGRQYFDEHEDDLLKSDRIFLSTEMRGYNFRYPRYFEKLLEEDYPESVEARKASNIQRSKELQALKLSLSNYTLDQMRAIDERNFDARTKILNQGVF